MLPLQYNISFSYKLYRLLGLCNWWHMTWIYAAKTVPMLKPDNIAQDALQREWGNFPFANWNGICWGLLLQLVQLIEIHFLPHLESFMWERKFEKKFFKKSHIQTPNGVLLIFKLPFPNGSYRNGVCRALWAMTVNFNFKNLFLLNSFISCKNCPSFLSPWGWIAFSALLMHCATWCGQFKK